MSSLRNDVIDWLLESDPAIRWQVLRDLLDAPEEVWRAERTRVEREGWGAKLFALQDADGQWAGGAFLPAGFTEQEWRTSGQAWTSTCWTMAQLREFGLEPSCGCARRTVELINQNARWDHAGQPYWDGEVEECINGRTVADAAYFGVDAAPIIRRLVQEQQNDGGWNCERARGSLVSSFDTTINVLEGLLEHSIKTGSTPTLNAVRRDGEEYLLCRRLYLGLRSGEVADPRFLQFTHPSRSAYDVLRALDYFRKASEHDGTKPDARLSEAIDHVRSKRLHDGRWALDRQLRGRRWIELDDGEGKPSRWITLRVLRVLKWWQSSADERAAAAARSS